MDSTTRFPVRFDSWYNILSSALLLLPSQSYLEIQGDHVFVRMSWAFRASFPRTAVMSATVMHERIMLSRGVHGFGGRWLVNGSGQGIVSIKLEPRQRARVVGFPVKLCELMISVNEPEKLIEALS